MIKLKPESRLLTAARVFNFNACADCDDDIVGIIRGTKIHAGELRRLNEAIAEEDVQRVLPDPADDGLETGLIRAFRAFPEGSNTRGAWRFICDSNA